MINLETLNLVPELGLVPSPQNRIEIVNQMDMVALKHIIDCYNTTGCYRGFHNEGTGIEKLDSGSYGSVYGYKEYAIKYLFDEDDFGSNDVEILKEINHLDCIPTLYAVIDNRLLIIERVFGETVRKYHNRDDNPYNIDKSILEQFENGLKAIIDEGYSPEDVHGRNVMISSKGKLMIVDTGCFVEHNREIHEHTYQYVGGYEDAQDWAGRELRQYIRKLEGKIQIEIGAEKSKVKTLAF